MFFKNTHLFIYSFNFIFTHVHTHTSSCLGAQDRPLQNITQWHVDYFKLKLFDKQLVPKGTLTSLVSLNTGNKSPLSKEGALLALGGLRDNRITRAKRSRAKGPVETSHVSFY